MDFEYWDIETGEGLSDNDLDERYSDMLDEVYGDVSIAGMEYPTSTALKELDPIAYRVGFADWLDSEIDETITDEAPADDEIVNGRLD